MTESVRRFLASHKNEVHTLYEWAELARIGGLSDTEIAALMAYFQDGIDQYVKC